MNNEFYINKIESYLNNIYIDIECFNKDLEKFILEPYINDKDIYLYIDSYLDYHKNEYIYDLNMIEIFCRAFRDKIENE